MRIRAITLHPEWTAAFRYMGKRVENRRWLPPRAIYDGVEGPHIALHSGLAWPGRERRERFAEICDDAGFKVEVLRDPGCLVIDGVMRNVPLGAVFATTWLTKVTRWSHGEKDPWAFGPYCWWFRNMEILPEPIEGKGKQRLWWAEV